MTQHIVQYSGGIGSWAAAKRIAAQHGTNNLTLLVADSRAEDPDLWRFVRESAAEIGVEPVIVADGRDPFEVFRDVRFLGNSRLAPCSYYLKQVPCRQWVEANADPADAVLYVGFDHTEGRRMPGTTAGWAPWRVEFPMAWEPYLSKEEMLDWCRACGIEPPRLYKWANHNNCDGLCVRAGQSHWALVWEHNPEGFALAERREQEMRDFLCKDVAILTETFRGVKYPLPLSRFRRGLEAQAAWPPRRRAA